MKSYVHDMYNYTITPNIHLCMYTKSAKYSKTKQKPINTIFIDFIDLFSQRSIKDNSAKITTELGQRNSSQKIPQKLTQKGFYYSTAKKIKLLFFYRLN